MVADALDEREWATVRDHLLLCEQCRDAVRRERHLKSRKPSGPRSPTPPAALVAALADRRVLADHVARQERRRTAAVHAAVTAGGLCASLAVLGLLLSGSSPLQARQAAPPAGGLRPSATLVISTPDQRASAHHGYPDGADRRTAPQGPHRTRPGVSLTAAAALTAPTMAPTATLDPTDEAARKAVR
jgi:hypothetical protein